LEAISQTWVQYKKSFNDTSSADV